MKASPKHRFTNCAQVFGPGLDVKYVDVAEVPRYLAGCRPQLSRHERDPADGAAQATGRLAAGR